MNDFSKLENELRKLRPVQPSPVLFQRVEEALQNCRATASVPEQAKRLPYTWWPLSLGLATAAVLILFAVVTMEHRHERQETVAQTAPASEIRRVPRGTDESVSLSKFVPSGGTHVVYNTRDEGLHFASGLDRPVRRVRYQTQQSWRWRDPETGASLRVSYPSEEIVLIPVSGQ